MAGSRLAIDTNVAIAVLNATVEPGIPADSDAEWVLPVQVIGELRFGALNSARAHENLHNVDRFVGRCGVLNTTAATARVYAHVRQQLHRAGRPIPENDLWIAASCLEHGLPLATSDGHFDAVVGLERYVAPPPPTNP